MVPILQDATACFSYSPPDLNLYFFYVLVTVHFSIFILVINQLDAKNFCFTISLFRNLYMLTLCNICYWNLTDRYYTKSTTKSSKNDKKIWTTFTFHSPKNRKITNLLKNTNIGIAFKTTTTLHHLITPITPTRLQEHEKSGIYKITCKTCHNAYVGQASRNLKSRFREHIRYIKNNDPRSAYALHILNCRHEHGNIANTMTLLKQINTPNLLLPYKQMYQSFHHNNELIPEQHLNEHNPMFDLRHSNTTRHNPPDA